MNKIIINLISFALFDCGDEITQDIDWAELYSFSKKQQISVLIYFGLLNSKIFVPQKILDKFQNDAFISIATSCNQIFEAERISAAFEKNHIDHMLLKGTLLKEIYPKPEMRQMGDVDILIRTKQTETITQVMDKLGFVYKYDSNHEIVWSKSDTLSIELHKMLIPSYNKDFYAYYGDGWNHAKKISGKAHGYQLSAEDNYIFIFTHFAKHYRDAGVGLKHIIDLYLLKKYIGNIEYVENELKKLQLFDFHRNVQNTLQVWFEKKEADKITDTITNRIFAGGAYGTSEARVLSSALKNTKTTGSVKNAILKKIIIMLFPSSSVMKKKYPILNNLPFLLPFLWIWRWGTALLLRQENVKIQATVAKTLNKQKIDMYHSELNLVGLDFNFKE